MKKIIVLAVFFISFCVYGQFQQTDGPTGGRFDSFTESDGDILALTSMGNIFRYSNDEWNHWALQSGTQDILTFNNSLLTLGYSGIWYYDENADDWMNVFDGQVRYHSVSHNRLYVICQDTVYHTSDGLNFTQTFDSLSMEVDFFGDTLSQRLINITNVTTSDSVVLLACFGELAVSDKGIVVSHNYGETWMTPEGLPDFTRVNDIVEFNGAYYLASNDGLYVSSDDGLSWQEQIDGFLPTEYNLIIWELTAQNGQLFALQSNPNQLFRLDGESWQAVSSVENISNVSPYGASQLILSNPDGVYLLDTETEETMTISNDLIASSPTILAYNSSTILANVGGNTTLTMDGGDSWTSVSARITNPAIYENSVVYVDSTGIVSTDDFGMTTTSLNGNLPGTKVDAVRTVVSDGPTLYAGFHRTRPRTHLPSVWEVGGLARSQDGGTTWQSINTGLPTEGSVPVPVSKVIVNGDLLVTSTIEGVFRSTNNGNTWSLFEAGLPEFGTPNRWEAFEERVFIANYMGIYFTDSQMDAWAPVTAGLDSVYRGFNYHFVPYDDDLYLYSNEERQFYVLQDSSWSAVPLEVEQRFQVNEFSVAGDVVYASIYDGGVWAGTLTTTGLQDNNLSVPHDISLAQNYPNPFNPSTTIHYGLSKKAVVNLTIYNVRGEKVTTLVNASRDAGSHTEIWKGRDQYDQPVSTGLYFYRLEAGGEVAMKKMMYVK